MNRLNLTRWILFTLLAGSSLAFASGPELINYQGYLEDDTGSPMTGTHDLTFAIYLDAAGLAPPLWSETHTVTLTEGLFDVILGSAAPFPSTLFDASERWMGIRVDSGEETDPLMRMTSVAWALRANVADVALTTPGGADSDWIVDGTGLHMFAGVPGNLGIGTTNPRRKVEITGQNAEDGLRLWWGSAYSSLYADLLHGGSGGFRINSSAGGGTWADIHLQTNGTTRVFVESRGDVGIGTTSPQAKLDVVGMLRTTGFTLPTGAANGWVLTSDAAGVASWQPAGGATGDGDWTIDGSDMVAANPGKVGIGTTSYRGKLSIRSVGDTGIHVYTDSEDAVFANNSTTSTTSRLAGPGYGVLGEVTTRSGIGVKGVSNEGFGIYGASDSVAVYGINLGSASTKGELGTDIHGVHGTYGTRTVGHLAGQNFGAYGEHVTSSNHGYLGGSTVGVYGQADGGTGVFGISQDGIGIFGQSDNGTGLNGFTFTGTAVVGIHAGAVNEGRLGNVDWGVYGYSGDDIGVKGNSPLGYGLFGTSDSGTGVYGHSGSGNAGHFNGSVLVENGHVSTPVLEITGGSDLSEGFAIHAADEIPPEAGMVVSVDARREGDLVVSSRAYDRCVAGVISGAGGVAPGVLMGQRGTAASGETPVALTGRVYCRVDAGFGSIAPGDLLTTSETPGHAMKADDPARSQGAVIGKAMGSLASGRGLILVLVNLQ